VSAVIAQQQLPRSKPYRPPIFGCRTVQRLSYFIGKIVTIQESEILKSEREKVGFLKI
jgi:hypothetical protein